MQITKSNTDSIAKTQLLTWPWPYFYVFCNYLQDPPPRSPAPILRPCPPHLSSAPVLRPCPPPLSSAPVLRPCPPPLSSAAVLRPCPPPRSSARSPRLSSAPVLRPCLPPRSSAPVLRAGAPPRSSQSCAVVRGGARPCAVVCGRVRSCAVLCRLGRNLSDQARVSCRSATAAYLRVGLGGFNRNCLGLPGFIGFNEFQDFQITYAALVCSSSLYIFVERMFGIRNA